MARIASLIETLRNNWKKSVFGCVVLTYGVRFIKSDSERSSLMIDYCKEAVKYGNVPCYPGTKLRNIVVFLNPAANIRGARAKFEDYCEPLLHLAGVKVTVVKTQSQGEARLLAENIDSDVDAVLVGGGDGTLSEVVTGLLRRENSDNPLPRRVPIGILPLGQKNTVAKSLFSDTAKNEIKMLAEATMAVIHEVKKPVDVMMIEQLDKEQEDQKPIYSLCALQWGAIHDVYEKRDEFWYWFFLKDHMAYIFKGLAEDGRGITWNCRANLHFTPPCNGCYECSQEPVRQKTGSRWWRILFQKKPSTLGTNSQKIDYSKIKNDACTELYEAKISPIDLMLETSDRNQEEKIEPEVPHLKISLGPPSVSYWNFVQRGWQYMKGNKIQSSNTLFVKDVKLLPDFPATLVTQRMFYIDHDEYEMKPIYVKLLPKRIVMFCQQQQQQQASKSVENVNKS